MRTVRRRPGQCLALALLLGTVSAIAASSLRWTGTSGGLRVAISDKDVVAADSNGIRSFSLRELFPNFESDDPEVDTHSAIYRPLSLVGPYLSLERDGFAYRIVDFLCALGDGLARDPSLWSEVTFRPNSTLYQIGDRLRYVESRPDGHERCHLRPHDGKIRTAIKDGLRERDDGAGLDGLSFLDEHLRHATGELGRN